VVHRFPRRHRRVHQQDHRRLEALGAVDRHDPDAAGPRLAGQGSFLLAAQQIGLLQLVDEVAQAASALVGGQGKVHQA